MFSLLSRRSLRLHSLLPHDSWNGVFNVDDVDDGDCSGRGGIGGW